MVDLSAVGPGDFVKVSVGGERLWFEVIRPAYPHAFLCRLDSTPASDITFDGRVTISEYWIVDVALKAHHQAANER